MNIALITENDRILNSTCPICGNGNYTPLFQVPFPNPSATGRRGFTLSEKVDVPTWIFARCEICKVQYACPRPDSQLINTYYTSQMTPNEWEKTHYVEMDPNSIKGWQSFAQSLTILRGSPGRLLEVGCAAGWLLKSAQECGWDVIGLEAAPKFYNYATNVLQLPVIPKTIDELNPDEIGYFDIIAMTDVIEHLRDPLTALQKLRRVISPKGFLVLTTCDIESTCAQFYGLEWRQIVISHIFYWTKKSIKLALEQAGFQVEYFSEPRYWHPDRYQEKLNCVREIIKFIARVVLNLSYVKLTNRFPYLQQLPHLLTGGRITHTTLIYKIGDQPVLGDVMLVVARPI